MLCHAHSARKFHPSNQKSITATLQLLFKQAPGCGRIIPTLQSSNLTRKIWNQLLFPAEKESCRGESVYPLIVTPIISGMKHGLGSENDAPNTPSRPGSAVRTGTRSGSDGALSSIHHLDWNTSSSKGQRMCR